MATITATETKLIPAGTNTHLQLAETIDTTDSYAVIYQNWDTGYRVTVPKGTTDKQVITEYDAVKAQMNL